MESGGAKHQGNVVGENVFDVKLLEHSAIILVQTLGTVESLEHRIQNWRDVLTRKLKKLQLSGCPIT